MLFEEIELDYEVENNARSDIRELIIQGSAEMNCFQHAFIAGIVKKYRPNKMVEIGVAAGGTTCFLHECGKRYHYTPSVFSVDKFEEYYRIPTEKTGYLINRMTLCEGYEGIVEFQKTIIGASIPFVIDEIGDDIDFLLLDTTHSLPGEMLDFLVCLPYLRVGSVVVLHDTICNLINNNGSYATKLLFDVVKAKKIINLNSEEESFTELPNIMAFEVTEDTIKSAKDVLSALSLDWQYGLEENEVCAYSDVFLKYYGLECEKLFLGINAVQTKNLLTRQISQYFNDDSLIQRWEKENLPVMLYGNGVWASKVLKLAKLKKLAVEAIVISDDRLVEKEISREIPIYKISDIPEKLMGLKLIYAMDIKYKKQIDIYVQEKNLKYV